MKPLFGRSVFASGVFSFSVRRFEYHCRDDASRLFLIIVSRNSPTQSTSIHLISTVSTVSDFSRVTKEYGVIRAKKLLDIPIASARIRRHGNATRNPKLKN